jgi:hypothetical protein
MIHKKETHNTDDCWVVRKFHEENGVTKRRGSSHSYGKGGSRGNHRDDNRDKVAAALVCHVQIPSRYRCLHQRTIIEKRTRGAIESREASPLAS